MSFVNTVKSILNSKTMVKWHMKGDIEHKKLYLASSNDAMRKVVRPNFEGLKDLSRFKGNRYGK